MLLFCGGTHSPLPLKVKSDRICAVEVVLTSHSTPKIVIFNVYAPSSDADMANFSECMLALEEEINRFHHAIPIVIAGDFNAHLGTFAGPRGSGAPNLRGYTLKEFIDRNHLFVASHSSTSSGPSYTYHSGKATSTVDYIIVNQSSCGLLASCKGLPDHPLNISDHLPLELSFQSISSESAPNPPTSKVHWKKAISSGAVSKYAQALDECVHQYLDTPL